MSLTLKDWLNSINHNKTNLMDEDEFAIKSYSPFIINKMLSGSIDTLFPANEMNKSHFIDKDMQYAYYLNVVKNKKRFAPWLKFKSTEDIDLIKEYYNYSTRKAKAVIDLLSADDLNEIRKEMNQGGT
jgi:hypothetical protein